MEENTDKPVISWPLDPVTQQSLRRWIGGQNSSYRYVVWRVLDSALSQSVAGTFGGDFEAPFGGTIMGVFAYVDTAGTTGSATIDIHKGGTTIMSATKISIETAEKSSRNAATQPVVTNISVTTGDIFTVDIDAIQTTPAKGLTVVMVINT